MLLFNFAIDPVFQLPSLYLRLNHSIFHTYNFIFYNLTEVSSQAGNFLKNILYQETTTLTNMSLYAILSLSDSQATHWEKAYKNHIWIFTFTSEWSDNSIPGTQKASSNYIQTLSWKLQCILKFI